jgi:anti-sigma-K factor RskA
MDLPHNTELLDRLAAAYALGTLRGGARRRFESLARQSPAVRAAALLWQERFAAMTELQLAHAPSPNVWKRIENMLASQPQGAVAAPQDGAWTRALRWWRGGALAAGAVAALAMGVALHLSGEVDSRDAQVAQGDRTRITLARQNAELAAQLQARPEIQYVAVLNDDRSSASMLVTFDPARGTLTIKRVGGFQEAADKSLQLWALPPSGGPRSLGVLSGDAVIKLTAAENQVKEAPALAVSLEPKGGVPGEGGPTGPVLFKGALLKTS